MSDKDLEIDNLSLSEKSIKPAIEEDLPSAPTKPKRVMSEKQLENLAKAREKANKVLKEKRARKTELRAQEKKLKELQLKQKEDMIQNQLNTLTKNVDVHGHPEQEQIKYIRKPVKKKKEPKIVYYSSSSSDDSEPEIRYVRKPKSRSRKYKKEIVHHHIPAPAPAHVPAPIPAPAPAPSPQPLHPNAYIHDDKQAMKEQYQQKVETMRRKYLMQTMFPTG